MTAAMWLLALLALAPSPRRDREVARESRRDREVTLTHFAPAPTNGPLANPNHAFWKKKAPARFRAHVETTEGTFAIEVHREWAPRGADRFFHLVRAGFFNDSRFYRVRAGFIAQFGIAGNPAIAQVWRNVALKDDPVKASNTRGRMAFAMTGPDTRTTQLFISLADNSRLDKDGFAPIGEVVEGIDIVDRIYSGYGEDSGGGMRGGKQAKLFEEGNTYLDREYPRLDRLVQISLVSRNKMR